MVRFQSSPTQGAVQSSEGDMKHLLLIVSVLIWASVSVADICSHLPGYSKNGTSCFRLYTSLKNWTDAEASCVADGSHLASIHSSEEQAFAAELAANHLAIWIGVSGVPPNMTWSDNTTMDYTAWAEENMHKNGQKCGGMRSVYSYLWDVGMCTRTVAYMCRAETVESNSGTTKSPAPVSSETTAQVTTQPVSATTTPAVTPSATAAAETQTYFTKIPGGVPMDGAAVPAFSHVVRSAIGCARRCQQDVQCVHFILSEDGGKNLCEIYTSLVRPPTSTPPTDNYQKAV